MGRKLKGQIGERPGESPANPVPAVVEGASNAREIVQLLKPHQHQGIDYPAYALLDVSQRTAAWLRAQLVVE